MKGAAAPLPSPLPMKLRPKQVAQLLGITPATLYAWWADREDFRAQVRRQRVGPRVTLVDTADVLAFIESKTV